MALTTTTSGGITSQSNTQSPQLSAGSGSAPTAAAKNVQPGTATSLLSGPESGNNGIALHQTALSIANLNTSAQTATISQPPAANKQSHHPNAVLLAVVAILVIIAILSTWLTHRSAKNTTEY